MNKDILDKKHHKQTQKKTNIFVFFKGMAMGAAEVVPGVSGGTIAFITGIYERLLNCIKSFDPKLVGIFRKEGIKSVWAAIDGTFLVNLLVGMVIGIGIGVFGIHHILEYYPIPTWAFFFGLIIASCIYIARQIKKWTITEIILLVVAGGFSYWITVLHQGDAPHTLPMVFLAGAIAISALILPGVSGSFILLLMGLYQYIVTDIVKGALKTLAPEKLLVMAVFALGCLTGLLTFSRVLSWTFKNYRNATLAALTGFMIGSLNKIWPWRVGDEESKVVKESGEVVYVQFTNYLPNHFPYENYFGIAMGAMIFGFAIVFVLDSVHKTTAKD